MLLAYTSVATQVVLCLTDMNDSKDVHGLTLQATSTELHFKVESTLKTDLILVQTLIDTIRNELEAHLGGEHTLIWTSNIAWVLTLKPRAFST